MSKIFPDSLPHFRKNWVTRNAVLLALDPAANIYLTLKAFDVYLRFFWTIHNIVRSLLWSIFTGALIETEGLLKLNFFGHNQLPNTCGFCHEFFIKLHSVWSRVFAWRVVYYRYGMLQEVFTLVGVCRDHEKLRIADLCLHSVNDGLLLAMTNLVLVFWWCWFPTRHGAWPRFEPRSPRI